MIIALAMSLTLIVAGLFNPDIIDSATQLIASVDFPKAVLDVMLSFLLFAGALHADVKTLSAERVPIFVFASLGVLISTFFFSSLQRSGYFYRCWGWELTISTALSLAH